MNLASWHCSCCLLGNISVNSLCFAVLGWQNTCESVDDIKATLGALAIEIDISVLYRGLDPKNVHRLVSVVCFLS